MIVALAIFVVAIFIVDRLVSRAPRQSGGSPQTAAIEHLRHHDVKRATLVTTTMTLELKDGTALRTTLPADRDVWPLLQNSGADIAIVRGGATGAPNFWLVNALQFLPIFLMGLLLFVVLRNVRPGVR